MKLIRKQYNVLTVGGERNKLEIYLNRRWRIGWGVQSWSLHLGRHQFSVSNRQRSARFGYEHYKSWEQRPEIDKKNDYHYYNLWFGSPRHHRWWARSIHLYLNLRSAA